MASKLIIRLNNTTLDSLLVKDDKGITQMDESNESEAVKLAMNSQEIIVLVPSVDVLLTQVKLPKLSPARMAKALPFALEDQLIEDTTNLHFAVGEKVGEEALPIAIVSKEKMAIWQSILQTQLKTTYSQVKALIPDVLTIPWTSGSFSICLDKEIALVRTGKQAGFAIEKEQLFSVLQLMINRLGAAKPTSIKIYGGEASTLFTPEEMNQLNISVEFVAQNDVLGTSLDEPYLINLLQGSYAPTHKKPSIEQLITFGLVLIGVWLILLTFDDIANYFILQREKGILNSEIKNIYANIYPNTKLPADPKASMQKELNRLRSTHADTAFFRLIRMTGPGLSEAIQSGLNLKGMSYHNNQLIVDIEAKELPELEKLKQSLETLGLKVDVSYAQRGAGGLVETRLTIEEVS